VQSQLSNTTNLKEKLEERLQIITEEANFLKIKQEEYTEQMHVLFEKVKYSLIDYILIIINVILQMILLDFNKNTYLLLIDQIKIKFKN